MADQDNRSKEEEEAQASSADTEVKDSSEKSENSDTSAAEQAELSRKAQQMGESRKRMAESLLSLAKSGNADAKAQLETLAQDESERSYFEKKFGEDFTSLLEEKKAVDPTGESLLNEKVELLVKDRETARSSQMSKVKEGLGLNLEKGEAFDDLVKTFEGKMIGGKPVSFADALDMAARQLAPSSPSANAIIRGDVSARPEDANEKVDVPISEEFMRKHKRFTKAESKEDYVGIVKAINESGTYQPAL